MINFDLPKNQSSIIKVLGVGGGGSNAVNHMHDLGIRGVDFVICNTDAQAMELSSIPTKIQLGEKGLGAGSVPMVGKQAAEENIEEIKALLEKNTKMLFITAGMGGGTGTGAAPVIASVARELGILTVAIVTLPFSFEGRKRKMQAEQGLNELREQVDTLLVISNDKLRELHGDLKLSEAFQQADNVLSTAAKGIAEIVTVTGYINVDFEDVRTVMEGSGKAIMGTAFAEGENRALEAVREAMASPLLDDNDISGASNILLYITSGVEEISMDEVTEITDYIQREAGMNADIIWGNGIDESLGEKIGVTLIATGFNSKNAAAPVQNKVVIPLDQEIKKEKPNTSFAAEKNMEEIQLLKKETQNCESSGTKNFASDDRVVIFDLYPEKTDTLHTLQKKKPDTATSVENKILLTATPEKAKDTQEQDFKEMEKMAQERVQKLRDLSIKLKTPGELERMEKEPAYLRRNIELSDTKPSSESLISRYYISENDKDNFNLRENNSFLHENVD